MIRRKFAQHPQSSSGNCYSCSMTTLLVICQQCRKSIECIGTTLCPLVCLVVLAGLPVIPVYCNRASHLWVEHANQTFLATMASRVDHDFGFSRQRQILHVCVHTIPVQYHTIHAYDTYVCPHDWWWWGSRKTRTKHFECTDIMAHHRLEEHGINTTRLDTSTESHRHTQSNLMQSHAYMWHVWDLMWVIVQHPLRLPATQLAGREPWATRWFHLQSEIMP